VCLAWCRCCVADSFLLNQFATYGVLALTALATACAGGFGGIPIGASASVRLGAYGMARRCRCSRRMRRTHPPVHAQQQPRSSSVSGSHSANTALGIHLSPLVPDAFCAGGGDLGGLMFRVGVSGPFSHHDAGNDERRVHVDLDIQPYTNGANGIRLPLPSNSGT